MRTCWRETSTVVRSRRSGGPARGCRRDRGRIGTTYTTGCRARFDGTGRIPAHAEPCHKSTYPADERHQRLVGIGRIEVTDPPTAVRPPVTPNQRALAREVLAERFLGPNEARQTDGIATRPKPGYTRTGRQSQLSCRRRPRRRRRRVPQARQAPIHVKVVIGREYAQAQAM